MGERLGPSALLAIATVLAVVSLFFHRMFPIHGLWAQLALGCMPILIGCVWASITYRAWQRSSRHWAVALYGFVIAPMAFSYPAWILFVWVMWVFGKYNGPMP